ncbi:unnamed protein product [Schistosoma margrebowiei]|uniref:Uncharacterized protein n=1 Tax=Schistosoma margrebowiei TaxID=48269 RepID=A0A183LID8_9TREM|nr:unnamed protein product [Schistosoma margrebowiei]
MKDNLKRMIKALALACQEVLCCKKHHHNEWISIQERESNKIAINNRGTRAEKVRAQAVYTEANKEIIRADKQKCVEKLQERKISDNYMKRNIVNQIDRPSTKKASQSLRFDDRETDGWNT